MMATFSSVTSVVARAAISRTSPTAAGDLDAVADLDRPFEQDNEPAEEIARDVLQTETEPHPTAPTSTFSDVRSMPAL